MVSPRSSITRRAQAVSTRSLDSPHQESRAPKKPKPSMVWYFTLRSTRTLASPAETALPGGAEAALPGGAEAALPGGAKPAPSASSPSEREKSRRFIITLALEIHQPA